MSDTIAAIATGAQISAIGIVRLSGPTVLPAVDALFHPFHGSAMSSAADRKLIYGNLVDSEGRTLDICLCTISRGPNSYTGEDTAEFQCHGSPVLLRAVMEELFRLGVRQAGPGEFTKRAFLNGRMDLISAEAVVDLIDAESVENVVNAAGQLEGTVSREIESIYSSLADISSHYHAVLDYPDEDIEDFTLSRYLGVMTQAADSLQALLNTFDRGRLMKAGIPAAIIGLPNAGKSSLLNALLGYERAIVTDIAGTTRDTIEEKVNLNGVSLRLIDTAGIHATQDVIEQLGVQRSLQAAAGAELVIAVIDSTAPFTEETLQVLRQAEAAPKGLVVLSKADLCEKSALPETVLPIVRVSSVTGEGLTALGQSVKELFPLPVVPAGGILTNLRHAEAVGRALEYMRAAQEAMRAGMTPDIVLTETEGAMEALGELSGRSVREDITNRIFSRFCVGK